MRGGLQPAQAEIVRAREERIRALRLEGKTHSQIARAVRINVRSVSRTLRRLGMTSDYVPPPRVDRDEVLRLMADGMPANWAAETLGVGAKTAREVAQAIPQRDEYIAEWSSVRLSILKSSRLAELHEMFQPA